MKRRGILLGLLALVACEAGPFSAEGPGHLNLIVTPNGAAGSFATARVVIDGPTQVDRVLESGTHTFNDLQVGSYRVALEVRGTGQDVAMMALTSGVSVTADQTTSVTLSPTDFSPSLPPNGSGTEGVPFSVSTPAVTNAAAYVFENDDNAEFSSPESVEVTTPTTQVTVPATGTHYVRVRSKSAYGGLSAWSSTQVFSIEAAPMLSITPSVISFSQPQGGINQGTGEAGTTTRTVTVSNTGGGTADVQITSDQFWLDVNPAQTVLNAGQSVVISLTQNRRAATLPTADYRATVSFSASNASNSPATIPADLQVVGTCASGPCPPAVPDGMIDTRMPPQAIQFQWTLNSNDETSVQLEQGAFDQAWVVVQNLPAGTTSHTADNVRSGIKLFYRVRACNSASGACSPQNLSGGPNANHDQVNGVIYYRNAEGNVTQSNSAGIQGMTVRLRECATWSDFTGDTSSGTCTTYVNGSDQTRSTEPSGRFVFDYLDAGVFEVSPEPGSAGFSSTNPGAVLYSLRDQVATASATFVAN